MEAASSSKSKRRLCLLDDPALGGGSLVAREHALLFGCSISYQHFPVMFFSGSNSGQILSGIEFAWPLVMIASSAFQAGASIIKVRKGKPLKV